MKSKILALWGYITEVVLTFILWFAISHWSTPSQILEFVIKTGNMWLRLTVGCLAASLTIVGFFIALLPRPFGAFLRRKQAAVTFLLALIMPVGIFFAASTVIVLTFWSPRVTIAGTALFLLLYAGVTFITLLTNLLGTYRLYIEFENEVEEQFSPREPEAHRRTRPDASLRR